MGRSSSTPTECEEIKLARGERFLRTPGCPCRGALVTQALFQGFAKSAHPWLSSYAPRWGEIRYRIYEPEY